MPMLSATAAAAGESAGFVDIVVTLDEASTNPVSVSYDTLNATANFHTSQPDFQRTSGTLVFAPGETSRTVRVNVVSNTGVERPELLWFELGQATNATVAQRLTPVLLVDNDATAGTPALSVGDVVVDESARTASFFVWLDRPSTLPVGVSYTTAGDTATAGADFSAASGLLSFAPGEVVKTVTVALADDALAEGDESFRLDLANPSNATLADRSGEATIGSSDAPPVGAPYVSARALATDEAATLRHVVVQLSAPSTNEVRVQFDLFGATANYHTSAPDFQRHNGTLVFAPGVTTMTVAMPVIDDTAAEGPELAWMELSAPVNAVVPQRLVPLLFFDNDATAGVPAISVSDPVVDERTGSASFFVWLNRPATSTVTVAYATGDDTAGAGSDYRAASGTLSFAPGEVVKTVHVDVADDAAAEREEFFKLLLSAPVNATLAEGAGRASIGASDGDAVGMPYVTAEALATDETAALQHVVIRLSAPSTNEVRVDFDIVGATANYHTSAPDFQRHNGTLVFAPGETTRTVAMPVINDSTDEGPEVAWIELSGPVNAVVPQRLVPVLFVDNDATAGTPAIAVGDAVVDESAGKASFFVTLDRPSTSAVSVAWTTAGDTAAAGSDFRAASGTLSFAPGEVVKTVQVDLENDGAAEVDEFFHLLLSAPVGATLADGRGTAQIGASDAPPVGAPYVSARPASADESQPMQHIVVQLSAPSTNEVRVSFDIVGATGNYHTSSPDFQRHNGTLVFAPGETTKQVPMPVVDNTAAEGREIAWFELDTPVNAIVSQRLMPIWLHDNDAIAGVPVASVGEAVIDERAGTATFFVSLDRPATGLVTVGYATADESAVAGADYRAAAGSLAFAPGEVVKAVVVDIHDDALAEPDEFFRLQLSTPGNATLGDAVGGAVIGRNDGALVSRPQLAATPLTLGEGDTLARFVVQLSAPSMNEVRVNFDITGGTANYHTSAPDFQRHTGTLVFAPGETTRVIASPLIDDTGAEGLESFTLNLSSAVNATLAQTQVSATLIDNDSGFSVQSRGVGNDVYTVSSVLDRIAESPRGGIDTVRSGVSYTLPDHVENLVLTGSAANGIGNAGQNVFRGTAGNNSFDGGAGVDTAVFGGARALYTYGGSTAQRTVSGGGDGTDTLFSIERLQFGDSILAGDTLPGQNTYLVYAMLNAAFGAAPGVAELSRWVAQYDRLGSTLDLAQAMITHYAPGVPDDVLVAHLWGTIVGTPIPLDALMLYSGLVADGTFTQASLLELVSGMELNTVEIAGIVGQPLLLDPAYFPVPG